MSNIQVYDIEILANFFCVVFENSHTKEIITFEVSKRKDERYELCKFLSEPNLKLVGYNNLGFDYPLLHMILTVPEMMDCTSRQFVERLKKRANDIIESMKSDIFKNRFKYIVAPWEVIVPQLDLFKLWHFDRKFVSLKALEFAMRFDNVQDLPYAHDAVLTEEQMDLVIQYCINDVGATSDFYKISKKHIAIRSFYEELGYNNLMSASEIGISKEVFTKELAIEMGVEQKLVKKLRTRRKQVHLKDIIFDYIQFNDNINKQTLAQFKKETYNDRSKMTEAQKKKDAIKFSVPYKNVVREYAEGGLHSCCQPGIYESDDEYVLVDLDFASFYPHVSFKNGLQNCDFF